MRVGILTSWRVPCGVYQYSARLADALSQTGHEPVILAGRADEHRSVPEESGHEVHDVAGIGMWRDDQQYWLDAERIRALELDAVHVQYQSMLFQQGDLAKLADRYRGPVAVTFHDNCQAPSFPYQKFDLKFTHRQGVGPADAEVLEFGVEVRKPVVRTFGLGRTRADIIGDLCLRNDWIFENAASHEPIFGGGQTWQTHDELIGWLRGADAIALWYDDQAAAGSSQAARTAMAARRFLVTNDTTWFSDLPDRTRGYAKVSTPEQMEAELHHEFFNSYTGEHSWTSTADRLMDCYRHAIRTAVA
jgi:hypothetical protein